MLISHPLLDAFDVVLNQREWDALVFPHHRRFWMLKAKLFVSSNNFFLAVCIYFFRLADFEVQLLTKEILGRYKTVAEGLYKANICSSPS